MESRFTFEGHDVAFAPDDTIAAAVYRSGVRTFSRSFKYHRRRGLYCLSGDCANCMLEVNGVSGVRSCVTAAEEGQIVRRENGWPSVERDLLSIVDRAHWLVPVGFYYKLLARPRWLWPALEPVLRRIAGRGRVTMHRSPNHREVRHSHPDVLVVGGGVAGLSAAETAAERGESVLVADEGTIGTAVAPGPVLNELLRLRRAVGSLDNVEVLEHAAAIGVYEGPLVPLNAPEQLELVHPQRVVIATGAVERHPVFPGNDLPGVLLGRGAARLAGCHGIRPGKVAVIAVASREGCEHVRVLRRAGVQVACVLAPADVAECVPSGVRIIIGGQVVAARGRRVVERAVVETSTGRERIACDLIVLSIGLVPRNGLFLQAADHNLSTAGDAAAPGLSLDEAIASGRAAGLGQKGTGTPSPAIEAPAEGGFVCPCEDVTVADLNTAWREGFRSTETLKRYTTACMGPCQGALCKIHLTSFVRARRQRPDAASAPTTHRPPARPISLEETAAGLRGHVQHRTRLHDRHVALGAHMQPTGEWLRPSYYRPLEEEYWAVRSRVSIMDVGTLGKYLVSGPDVVEFLERLYPCHVADLAPNRMRYGLPLDETGFVRDDGMICALDKGRWYLTFTSAGAARAEAWLHDWREQWALDVHIANRTAALGAINVAGPGARALLSELSDDDFSNKTFPYLRHMKVQIAGIPCRAIRLGFVGELSYELHHPSSRSVELWDALVNAGTPRGLAPHGLNTLKLLRLEKSHIIIGQDTDYDSTPAKLNMDWAVKLDKPWFVGKAGIERTAIMSPTRRLVPLRFEGVPREGSVVLSRGRNVGHLTSSGYSYSLDCGIALGWIAAGESQVATSLCADGCDGVVAAASPYDPEGSRLRD